MAAIACGGFVASAAATEFFQLDSFSAWRNTTGNLALSDFSVGPGSFPAVYGWAGKQYFADGFGDGIAPPFGSNGTTVAYGMSGNFSGAEHDSILEFNRARSVVSASDNGLPLTLQSLRYSPVGLPATSALRLSDSFAVGALFDLATPDLGTRYSVRLTDQFSPIGGSSATSDVLDLRIKTTEAGTQAEMYFQDFQAGTKTSIGVEAFAPPPEAAEIFLMLLKDQANDPTVSGYYRFLDASRVMLGDWHFLGSQDLFHGETVTQAGVYSFFEGSPVPEPQTYSMILVGLLLVGISRKRRIS
ncbi:MAG: hypothetical protein JWL63_3545 [Rhodocyclales bacterium]|nr:hypothetical protein [Rhodocyclales bacterium]